MPNSRLQTPSLALHEQRHWLFNPRSRHTQPTRSEANRFPHLPGLSFGDTIVFLLWALVLAYTVHRHIPFADEAQAWLIAKDCTLREILLRRLHYEGAPAPWVMLLWVVTRLHLPFAAINWIAGTLASPGIYILLRYAPFPRIYRWLLPFSFYLQYQYAVVARQYVLAPALIFLLAIVFTRKQPKPVLFALVAGAVANLGFQAAIVAGVFSLLYLVRLSGIRTRQPALVPLLRVALAAAILLVLMACSIVVAFPAPDVVIAGRPMVTTINPSPMLNKLVPPERLPANALPLDSPIDPAAGIAAAPVDPKAKPPVDFHGKTTLLSAGSVAFFLVANSNVLAALFLLALAAWLWGRRQLPLILPFAIAIMLAVRVFVWDHHTGVFWLALLAAIWIALESVPPAPVRQIPWLAPAFSVVALVVLLLQIGWSIHCVYEETVDRYDPGYDTAQFLAQHFSGKRIAGFGFEAVSTEVWADHHLFYNQPYRFWIWSIPVYPDRRRTEVLLQHPDAVVVTDFTSNPGVLFNQIVPLIPVHSHMYKQMLDYWAQHGYHETHRFCGSRLTRNSSGDTQCEVIYEPDSANTASR